MPDSIIEHKSRDEAHIRIKKEQNEIQEYLKDIKFKFLLYNTDIDIKYLNNEELQKIKSSKCNNCGSTGNGFALEIDHIIPLSLGGIHKKDNFQTLCKSCNASKNNNLQYFDLKLINEYVQIELNKLYDYKNIEEELNKIIKKNILKNIINSSTKNLNNYVQSYIDNNFINTDFNKWLKKIIKYKINYINHH